MNALAPTLLAAAFALTACGSVSEEDRVRDAYMEYVHALADGDDERVCEQLTPRTRGLLTGNGSDPCTRAVNSVREIFDDDDIERLHAASITSVAITGDTALVRVARPVLGEAPTKLSRIRGEWLIEVG